VPDRGDKAVDMARNFDVNNLKEAARFDSGTIVFYSAFGWGFGLHCTTYLPCAERQAVL
jgi:hypothetical protein